MKRKRHYTKKRTVSLAHRRKFYFVRPDEDMRVVWNLNNYIAKYAALVLKAFIEYSDTNWATPGEFCHFGDDNDGAKEYQAWRSCLEEMLFAFEYYADEYRPQLTDDEEMKRRVQHGLDLFAKYYKDLWN